ncbi:hypothetical protein ABZ471_23450 [Streptomyces sp. NPDC005728]|uniref:hypothetical protein n=1 Tax=Streptomyces sp. NPDC005728 TaxID=3157054 RepID=UPI0033C74DB2
MDDTQKAQEPQTPRDPSISTRSLPLGRLATAVAGTVALVALSVGVALAATSGDDPGPGQSVTSTVPPDTDSAGTSDGGTVGVSSGTDGGTASGSAGTDGGTVGGSGSTGGADPSPTSTSPDDPPIPDPDPSGEPTPPGDLAELNRRITELDRKVDQLPTKKELADALRAFADELDRSGGGQPQPDPS